MTIGYSRASILNKCEQKGGVLMRKVDLRGGLFILLCCAVLSACSDPDREDPRQNQTALSAAEQAETVYKKQCLSCHAADLGGQVGPSLQQVGTKLTEEQIMEVIRDGAKGMPSFEKILSPADIDTLAQWLFAKAEGTEGST